MEKIAGYCPMGCGKTLFAGKGGHVTCSSTDCPDPGCVDDLLLTHETEHIAVFKDDSFTVQHPLREHRDKLFECDVWKRLQGLSEPPGEPGQYRVTVRQTDAVSESRRSGDVGLDFERIPAAA